MKLLKRLSAKLRELLLRLSFKTNNIFFHKFLRYIAFSLKATQRQRDARLWCREGEIVLCCGMWRAESLESWVGTVAPKKAGAKKGFVYVLEADPMNCEVLEFEAERRGLQDRCKIINVALWACKSKLTLQRRVISDCNIIKQANAVGKNTDLELESHQRD